MENLEQKRKLEELLELKQLVKKLTSDLMSEIMSGTANNYDLFNAAKHIVDKFDLGCDHCCSNPCKCTA